MISALRAHGIEVRTSDRVKSDIYKTLVPIELLDVPVLRTQFLALERRTGRSGKEIIDHPPRHRDDVVNAAAGAIVEAHTHATRGPFFAAIRAAGTAPGRPYPEWQDEYWGRPRDDGYRSHAMQHLLDQKAARKAQERARLIQPHGEH